MAKLSFFLQEWGSGDRPLAYYYPVSDRFWPLASHSPSVPVPEFTWLKLHHCSLVYYISDQGNALHEAAQPLTRTACVTRTNCCYILPPILTQWRSRGSQVDIKLQSSGFQVTSSGSQVEVECKSSGNVVVVQWLGILEFSPLSEWK